MSKTRKRIKEWLGLRDDSRPPNTSESISVASSSQSSVASSSQVSDGSLDGTLKALRDLTKDQLKTLTSWFRLSRKPTGLAKSQCTLAVLAFRELLKSSQVTGYISDDDMS